MKEHIDEMASIVCRQYKDGKCLVYGKCEDNCSFREDYKRLYNAGYRKQKKAEWVMIPVNGVARWRCGNLDCASIIPFGTVTSELKYCPNCGAKMKGGAE